MDNQERKNWITEGIIIASVPFLGYLFAFAYESGYAIFFNFPKELINIGLPQIVIAISILYTASALLFFGIEGLSFVFFKNKPALYHSIVKFLPLFGFAIGYFVIYGWAVAMPFIILVIFLGFSEFIAPLITQRDKRGYENKLQGYDEADWKVREERGAFSVRLLKIFDRKNIMFILNLFICVGLTQMLGEAVASRQVKFFVIPSNPEKVVLRIYSDNLICAEFDREKKILKRGVYFYKLTDPQVQDFKLEPLGQFKVEKNREK